MYSPNFNGYNTAAFGMNRDPTIVIMLAFALEIAS